MLFVQKYQQQLLQQGGKGLGLSCDVGSLHSVVSKLLSCGQPIGAFQHSCGQGALMPSLSLVVSLARSLDEDQMERRVDGRE